jgi:hypothetical protein
MVFFCVSLWWCLCRSALLVVSLHLGSNRPYKAQQFSPDGGYDLLLILAGREQLAIALVQSMLGLPG